MVFTTVVFNAIGATRMSDMTPDDTPLWRKRAETPSAVIGIVMSLMLAAGGWVWHLSGQASQTNSLERRVTVLENSEGNLDNKLSGMSDRLSRMEPMLEYMVTQMQHLPK